MPLIDFGALILNIDDSEIKDADGALTLERVCVMALMAQGPKEEPTGQEKFERFQLAVKLKGEVDLRAEDVTLLKKLIGNVCTPLVVGRAWLLLDPPKKPATE